MLFKDIEFGKSIICGDCLEVMKNFEDESIDMILTSPPYDNLRDYKGYSFDFENIAKEFYRILKNGGVIVWVVGDSVIDGSESLTSFKQALYFKEIGFNIHDTMIYGKLGCQYPESIRYYQIFEYMFVISKGKPKTINLLRENRTNKLLRLKRNTSRNKDGSMKKQYFQQIHEDKVRDNIWYYAPGYQKSTLDIIAFKHPAIFPEKLAEDHILSWSNENDIVLDPFAGSGTTLKMAYKHKRRYIGIEISKEYIDIAKERISYLENQLTLI